MKQAVIDASVVLKWYLKDEAHGANALMLLDKYILNRLDLFAPALLQYEVINALIIAQKRGRVKDETILKAIEGFASLEIKFMDISRLYITIMNYCRVYKCSAYDASYLSIAYHEGMPFITSDERLYNSVKKDLKWVKWIGDI